MKTIIKYPISLLTVLFTACVGHAGQVDDFYSFKKTEPLPQPSAGIAAVAGLDNKIYTIGGYGYFMKALPIASNLIRIYDTSSHRWSVSPIQLSKPRMYLAAITTTDGKIIIAGGISQENEGLDSVEIFDPTIVPTDKVGNTCKILGKMSSPRRSAVLNLLNDGRILVTGNTKQADIIEPDGKGSYNIRPTKGKQNVSRDEHAAVTLADGRVLLVGGRHKTMEIFDPKTESFTLVKAKFEAAYDDQSVALLSTGKVLIVGGQNGATASCTNQTWLYDQEKDLLTAGQKLMPIAEDKSCVGISDMQIVDFYNDPARKGNIFLLCGGEDDNGKSDAIISSAWLYLALTNEFLEVGPMNQPHDDFKAVSFATSEKLQALIIDGHTTNDKITGCVEIFSCQAGIK